jgi:hypothetical protein
MDPKIPVPGLSVEGQTNKFQAAWKLLTIMSVIPTEVKGLHKKKNGIYSRSFP